MFDRQLLKLIGGNKKYVVYTVLLMVLGMLANIGILFAAILFLDDRADTFILYLRGY